MKKKLSDYAVRIEKAQAAFEANSAARSLVGKNISVLSEHIKAIHSSVKEVNSISMQVKILSLNASVEAVRAGSAGASFSVVASEINKLSQITDATVKKIEENVAQMKTVLDNTIADMSKAKDLGTEFENQLSQCVKDAYDLSLISGNDD